MVVETQYWPFCCTVYSTDVSCLCNFYICFFFQPYFYPHTPSFAFLLHVPSLRQAHDFLSVLMNYFFGGVIHQFKYAWQMMHMLPYRAVSFFFFFYSASTLWPDSCIHLNALVSWRSVWLATVEAITPDVYRSFSLGWIYFYKSIQICFCAASCTRGVNVLYKVFRSGIRFSPNSISQFSVFSRAFIILTVADKAIIFPPATTKCRQVPLWQCVCLRGEHKYYSAGHWWQALLATKPYQVEHNENRCYEHFCVLMRTSVSSFFFFFYTETVSKPLLFSRKPLTATQQSVLRDDFTFRPGFLPLEGIFTH